MSRRLRTASAAVLLGVTACGAGPVIRVEPRESGFPAVCAPSRTTFEQALAEAEAEAAAEAGRDRPGGSEHANLKYYVASRVVTLGLPECFGKADIARVERERRASICAGRPTCPPMPFSYAS